MKQYLLNYVKTGNPNVEGLPVWKTFAQAPEEIMELGTNVGMISNPRQKAYDLMRKHFT